MTVQEFRHMQYLFADCRYPFGISDGESISALTASNWNSYKDINVLLFYFDPELERIIIIPESN
jgi:hypothetical protein